MDGKCFSCGHNSEKCLNFGLDINYDSLPAGNAQKAYYFLTAATSPFCGTYLMQYICIYYNLNYSKLCIKQTLVNDPVIYRSDA